MLFLLFLHYLLLEAIDSFDYLFNFLLLQRRVKRKA